LPDREPELGAQASSPRRPAELDAVSELALVSYAARLLLSQLDRRLLLEHGLETFLDFARGRRGGVYLLDAGGERLRLASGAAMRVGAHDGSDGGTELPAGESPWREALAGRMPRSVELSAVEPRECLSVPLVGAANRVLGLVAIERDARDPLEECRTQSLLVLQSILALGLEQAAARERLLEANQELENLDAARTKMIDHLSHELKTPLAVVAASSALLERAAVRHDDARACAVLARVGRALDRLLELQEEARDIASGSAAGVEASQEIALESWVPEVLASIAPLHRHRAVHVEAACQPAPPIVAPEPLLRKALVGLVRNAIEATPDGGWVRVASGAREAAPARGTAPLRGAAPARETHVVLEVADSGVGFDEATRRQLFLGFVHAGATDDYRSGRPYDFGAGGRGLDLLRTRHFADRHGVSIEVESEPGKGSRFRLVFPAAPSRQESGASGRAATGASATGADDPSAAGGKRS
jgi:signal transduction histidine kinase